MSLFATQKANPYFFLFLIPIFTYFLNEGKKCIYFRLKKFRKRIQQVVIMGKKVYGPRFVWTLHKLAYRLSHIKFHSVIGRRRITIQPPPSGLVKFNM